MGAFFGSSRNVDKYPPTLNQHEFVNLSDPYIKLMYKEKLYAYHAGIEYFTYERLSQGQFDDNVREADILKKQRQFAGLSQ
jgi:hypothetical protein